MKVLVIDEDKFAQSVYESELHQQNISVELAKDGLEGVEKAKETKPDIIILELIVTKKNGFEVLEEIKQDADIKNTPVVVCSSLSQKNDVDEAMRLGALKYFSKEEYSLKQVVKEVMNILINQ